MEDQRQSDDDSGGEEDHDDKDQDFQLSGKDSDSDDLADSDADSGADSGADSDDEEWDGTIFEHLGIVPTGDLKAKAVRKALKEVAQNLGVPCRCLRKLAKAFGRLHPAIGFEESSEMLSMAALVKRALCLDPPPSDEMMMQMLAFGRELSACLDTPQLRAFLGDAAEPLFKIHGGNLVGALKNVPRLLAFALAAQGCNRAVEVQKKALANQGPVMTTFLRVLMHHGLDEHAAGALATASSPPEPIQELGRKAASEAFHALKQKEPAALLKCLLPRIVELFGDAPALLGINLVGPKESYELLRDMAPPKGMAGTGKKTFQAFFKMELVVPGSRQAWELVSSSIDAIDGKEAGAFKQSNAFFDTEFGNLYKIAQGFDSIGVPDDTPRSVYDVFKRMLGAGGAGAPAATAKTLRACSDALRSSGVDKLAVFTRFNGIEHQIKCEAEARIGRTVGRAKHTGYSIMLDLCDPGPVLPGIFGDKYVYEPGLWHIVVAVPPSRVGDFGFRHPPLNPQSVLEEADASCAASLKRKRGDSWPAGRVTGSVRTSGRGKAPAWHASRNPSEAQKAARRAQRAASLAA